MTDRGTLGDMFGVINALFSGLAFAGLIYTILLQRAELSLTRDELKGQKIELKHQAKELSLQNYENKFFQLIKLFNVIIESINYHDDEHGTKQGRVAIISLCYVLRSFYYEKTRKKGLSVTDEKIIFKDYFKRYSHTLSYLINTTKNILEFLDHNKEHDSSLYVKIFKSILSEQELIILFYASINDIELNRYLKEFEIITDEFNDKLISPTHYSIFSIVS